MEMDYPIKSLRRGCGGLTRPGRRDFRKSAVRALCAVGESRAGDWDVVVVRGGWVCAGEWWGGLAVLNAC